MQTIYQHMEAKPHLIFVARTHNTFTWFLLQTLRIPEYRIISNAVVHSFKGGLGFSQMAPLAPFLYKKEIQSLQKSRSLQKSEILQIFNKPISMHMKCNILTISKKSTNIYYHIQNGLLLKKLKFNSVNCL